jgi:hypothetical protein
MKEPFQRSLGKGSKEDDREIRGILRRIDVLARYRLGLFISEGKDGAAVTDRRLRV